MPIHSLQINNNNKHIKINNNIILCQKAREEWALKSLYVNLYEKTTQTQRAIATQHPVTAKNVEKKIETSERGMIPGPNKNIIKFLFNRHQQPHHRLSSIRSGQQSVSHNVNVYIC